MKKTVLFLVLLLCLSSACAHSGRTDSSGGHKNHSTGEYHYHHGYPAHQHENGVCPYNLDDKTGQSSGSSGSSSGSISSSSSNEDFLRSYLYSGDRGDDVKRLQNRLNSLGYACGTADGIFGAKTQSALQSFQESQNLSPTGTANYVTMCRLFPELAPTPTPNPTSTPRPTSTPKPKAVKNSWFSELDYDTQTLIILGFIFFLMASPVFLWLLFRYVRSKYLIHKNKKDFWPYRWTIEANPDTVLFVQDRLIHSRRDCSNIISGSPILSKPISECVGYPAVPCPKCISTMELTDAVISQKKAAELKAEEMRKAEEEKKKKLEEERIRKEIEDQKRQKALEEERKHREAKEKEERRVQIFRDHVKYCLERQGPPDLREGLVYVSKITTGVYHHNPHCSEYGLILVSKQSLNGAGFCLCEKCGSSPQPNPEISVLISRRGKCYHTTLSWCLSYRHEKEVTLREAESLNLFPCPRCHPEKDIPKIWF